jgi:hypothetical protein
MGILSVTIAIPRTGVATARDGRWRSTVPGLAEALNRDCPIKDPEDGRYHPSFELWAANRAVETFGAEIVYIDETDGDPNIVY